MLTDTDIKSRRPVWTSLSQLWLDNVLDDNDLENIAQVMNNSGYSIDTLHNIYLYEVAPVVYTNLLCPAGVWDGFDESWLHQKIIASLRSRSSLGKIFLKLNRRAMTYASKESWDMLIQRVKELRAL